MNIKELAEQADIHFKRGGFLGGDINGIATYIGFPKLEKFAELVAAEERNRCIGIIENYKIHVGASTAGEIACEMTYSALRNIRDEINGETQND